MKKLLFLMTCLAFFAGAKAQHSVSSPHPDLNIKITRAAEASGVLVVDMVITNLGKESKVRLGRENCGNAGSSAYDDEGNSYLQMQNAKITIGLQTVGLEEGTFITFPQDIPLKVRLQIEKIDPKATKMSLIKIYTDSDALGIKDKYIQIRNLEFERQ